MGEITDYLHGETIMDWTEKARKGAKELI